MRWIDDKVPYTGGRTPRELVILGGGIALCTLTLMHGHVDWGNLCVYAGATLAFGLRFYLARAIGVGACIGAIAQQWPHLRYGLDHANVETLAVLPLVTIVLLCSRDLVERFDRAPTALPGLPNPWAAFTLAQTRTVRWSCYAAGALAGLLDHTLQHPVEAAEAPLWPRVGMIAVIVAVALLGLGRALGLLMVWVIGAAVAILIAPDLAPAERALTGDAWALLELYTFLPHYVLPIFVLAVAATGIATPFTARLLRRTLFAGGDARS